MNTGRPKGNQKHLDLSARIIIEQHLNNGDSFRSIAIELNKDPSTISKEIRRHSIIRERSADAFAPIPCANNYDSSKPRTNICNVMHMCGDNECRHTGTNVSSAENSDAAMSVNFINQENVKN